jgi:hypothetical protein
MEPISEDAALGLLCDHLPALARRAAEQGWAARLERKLGRVRDQTRTAVNVCREFGLVDDGSADTTERGMGGEETPGGYDPIPGLSATPPIGRGSYRCPRGLCTRCGERDARGHPPICALFGGPMRPLASERDTDG